MTFEFVITGKTRSQIADVLRYIAFDIAHCDKVADVKQLKMSGESVEIAYHETRPVGAYTEAEKASAFEAWSWFTHLKNAALGLEKGNEDVRSGGDAYTVDYSPQKADCLNGSPHLYKPTSTYPAEYAMVRCTVCEKVDFTATRALQDARRAISEGSKS